MADPGDLTELITFEAPSIAGDGYGGGPVSWGEHARAWARLRPVRGREAELQGAERAPLTYMVEVWNDGLDGLTEAMRIKWPATAYNDVLLNIREIRRPPHRHMMMTIVAEAGVTL